MYRYTKYCTREKASCPPFDWQAPDRTDLLAERFQVHLCVATQVGLQLFWASIVLINGSRCTYERAPFPNKKTCCWVLTECKVLPSRWHHPRTLPLCVGCITLCFDFVLSCDLWFCFAVVFSPSLPSFWSLV